MSINCLFAVLEFTVYVLLDSDKCYDHKQLKIRWGMSFKDFVFGS
jgi:hypothetical protein